jgi:iron complex outermembrane receptor protein
MKQFVLIIASITLLVSIPFSLYGQEKEVTLEKVVVTGTRDVQEIRKIPANVTVITKDEIERSSAQTTVDLLRDQVGVVVRDFYGNGKAAAVDIRGFGETGPLNTLVLVDGRRVNEIDLSGVDWSQIPLDQIERIEIVRGPSSVLYGDNAVGGVINIITMKPEKTFSAKVDGILGSYHLNKESGSVSGKWGHFSAILNAGYNATDGYRENGFFRAKDVGGKLIYEVNPNIAFNFSGSLHEDDAGLPGELPEDIYRTDRKATRRPDDHAETVDEHASLGAKVRLWKVGRMEVDLSYRDREVEDFFRSFSFQSKRNLDTWGFTPKYILERPLSKFPNKLTAGFDFYDSESDVFSESVFSGPNHLEVTKRSTGLYLLDEFSILKNLILSPGYRHEWVKYDLSQEVPRARDKLRDKESAWNVGLDYLFGKRSSAFLSVKRSFRFPVSDELIQFFPVFQVNPDIKPQAGYHYEAGVRHALTDKVEANLTLFWIDMQDEIFFNPLTFSNENLSRTRRLGMEVGAKAKPLPWLSLWANYGFMKPRIRGDGFSGSEIPGVPNHKGSLGADLFWKGLQFDTRINIVGSRHFISDFSNDVERLDGHYTLDAKLSYSWRSLKAFFGVNNLTNREYAEFGVIDAAGSQFFYPSPERNYIGGISYTF